MGGLWQRQTFDSFLFWGFLGRRELGEIKREKGHADRSLHFLPYYFLWVSRQILYS